MYYNTFVPQYISQWCELNSERLISPVFRLFQGELETVYEEKNMYSDNILMQAMEKFMSTAFAGTPYEYPIIGSTENLKNPRLSEMQAFYDKYYVAGNMALILSGDINGDSIMSVIEKTFGRIKSGTAPERLIKEPKPFDGNTTVGIKVPIPLMKAIGRCYRGPKISDKDAVALDVAIKLLMNDQKTGLLDSITDAGKWIMGFAGYISNRDAGTILIGAVPNAPFGSKKKAERMLVTQIERLKKGDFSVETLEDIKRESTRDRLTDMENIPKRANRMISAYTESGSWDEYLKRNESVKDITKADIMRVADKYLNNNYITLVKKFGSYDKDKVTQPGYKAITPKNVGSESEYAKALDSIPVKPVDIRLVDFDNDVRKTEISPLVKLYTAPNPMNDIFTMRLTYRAGAMNNPTNAVVGDLLDNLGTDSLTRTGFGKALQRIGTTITQDISKKSFTIDISGYDSQLEPSLQLLGAYINLPKAPTTAERVVSSLWGSYFGSGMSSLMFQELKEFRSFAYYAGGSMAYPPKNAHGQSSTAYVATMSTQADKTLAALSVLDSLFNDMPVREKTFNTTKQSYINGINNGYPSFRGKAGYVEDNVFLGYAHDPNKELWEDINKVTMTDICDYYKNNVKQAPCAIIIVGKIDKAQMDALKKYGEVRLLTKKDIINM